MHIVRRLVRAIAAIALANTSLLGGAGGERLVNFGFGIDTNATSVGFVDVADGGMVNAGAASGALPAVVPGTSTALMGMGLLLRVSSFVFRRCTAATR